MVIDTLKKMFPPPKLPQKRYLVILGLALYYLAKAYTASTLDPNDDQLPDQVKNIVTTVFSDHS